MKKRVLFLCTHNSCRSQMAEGLINHYLGDRFHAYSAGTESTRVNPLAIRVMSELDINISHHFSKTIAAFDGQQFDHVITLCNSANEQCPLFFGGIKRVHIGFDDPSCCPGSDDEKMPDFRRVRDELRQKLSAYLTGSEPFSSAV
ncbi:MAG: arsenate reductase ArsC [Desulfuromonadaceae bacterium]|nr:arsenate reductase ArsC [Desulfuromonadaceae bacterium]MDD5104500.1 arsenate reductase ArsC [Desulfuromonadaceae bacterium]